MTSARPTNGSGRFARFALTAGGLGLLRPAPGTWGSLPPVVVAVVMVWLALPAWQVNAAMLVLCALGTLTCLRYGDAAEITFGRKDPGAVVADEVAGQSIALLGLPWILGDLRTALVFAGFAFVAFRLLDIIKPPPAYGLQSRAGGLGIVLDDLVAGVYACGVAHLATRLLWPAL
ncbi:MAG: phosphatidylglycerophosphatase A [Phycisphaerae bacterium]|nr:phosphatidylglycerophosphatase A [Phycisphaerae bacterium]